MAEAVALVLRDSVEDMAALLRARGGYAAVQASLSVPLLAQCRSGRMAAVLCESGADPNARGADGIPTLHTLVAVYRDPPVLAAILDVLAAHGLDAMCLAPSGMTAAYYAQGGETLRCLVRRGVALDHCGSGSGASVLSMHLALAAARHATQPGYALQSDRSIRLARAAVFCGASTDSPCIRYVLRYASEEVRLAYRSICDEHRWQQQALTFVLANARRRPRLPPELVHIVLEGH